MTTARALGIVPLAPQAHHLPVAEWQKQAWSTTAGIGGGRFQHTGQGRELIRTKPVEEMCCLLMTMYIVCHAVAMMPDDVQLGVRRDGLVVNMK